MEQKHSLQYLLANKIEIFSVSEKPSTDLSDSSSTRSDVFSLEVLSLGTLAIHSTYYMAQNQHGKSWCRYARLSNVTGTCINRHHMITMITLWVGT